MARQNTAPAVDALAKERRRVRKRYKTKLNVRTKIRPGQMEYVVDQVLVMKLVNYSNSQIARTVGISRGQVKEILAEPKVAERFIKLKENLAQGAFDLIQSLMIESVIAIAMVMRTSDDEAIILKAAGDLLNRGGVPQMSRTETTQYRTNESRITIGADEEMMQAIQSLPPEKQEEAAQMVENLENFLREQATQQNTEVDDESAS